MKIEKSVILHLNNDEIKSLTELLAMTNINNVVKNYDDGTVQMYNRDRLKSMYNMYTKLMDL